MTAAQIIREARLKAGLTQSRARRATRPRAGAGSALGDRRAGAELREPAAPPSRPAASCCKIEIVERASTPELDAELETSVPQAPQQRVQALLDELERDGEQAAAVRPVRAVRRARSRACQLRRRRRLRARRPRQRRDHRRARHRAVAAGGEPAPARPRPRANSARASRRSAERARIARAGDARRRAAGELRIVPEPWGTRGYDDLRIRANRENLGRGARPPVASVVDCVRMLDASERAPDAERLVRLRRMMELERAARPQPRPRHRRADDLPAMTLSPYSNYSAAIASETQMHRRCRTPQHCCKE